MLAVLPQEPVPGSVERSAVHPRARVAYESLRAREHLLRRPPGEREKQDALGLYAPFDQVCDTIYERARLARTGARDDEQGTVAVFGGRELFGVELRAEIASRRLYFALSAWIDPQLIGHVSKYNAARLARQQISARRTADPLSCC